jgi:hypothetical protein
MNLAIRGVRYRLGRFLLTAVALGSLMTTAAVIAVTHNEPMMEGFDRVYPVVDGRIDRNGRPSRPALDGGGVVAPMAHA